MLKNVFITALLIAWMVFGVWCAMQPSLKASNSSTRCR